MRHIWLLDVPTETRLQVYVELFKEKVYKVHWLSHVNLESRAFQDQKRVEGISDKPCDLIQDPRKLFMTCKQVYEESLDVFLSASLFDLRGCNLVRSCDPIIFLEQNPDILAKMTRFLCYGGSTPKLLKTMKDYIGRDTNVSKLQELNLSYSFEDVNEMVGGNVNRKKWLSYIYEARLCNHLQSVREAFPKVKLRLCARKEKVIEQVLVPVEITQERTERQRGINSWYESAIQTHRVKEVVSFKCEMLSFSETTCTVHAAKMPVEREIALENYIKEKMKLDSSMSVVFSSSKDAAVHAWISKLEYKNVPRA